MRNRILLALAIGGLAATPALAQDDLEAAGAKVFRKCAVCHQIGPDAKNRVGPALNGIIGEKAGAVEGFKFSDAMIEAGDNGLVWNDETLDTYLEDPKAMVPHNKMAFPGLKKEEDRKAVIAFIKANGGEG